jgi:hypothetical protein
MPATYAFDAKTWQQCVGRPVVLSRVFRQKDNGTPHVFMPIVKLMLQWLRFCPNAIGNESWSIKFADYCTVQTAFSANRLR